MSPIPGSNEPAKIFPYKIKEPAKTFFSQKIRYRSGLRGVRILVHKIFIIYTH